MVATQEMRAWANVARFVPKQVAAVLILVVG
jgi:hypothetical protein